MVEANKNIWKTFQEEGIEGVIEEASEREVSRNLLVGDTREEIEKIEVLLLCTRLLVQAVARHVKFLSDHLMESQFIAAIVSRDEVQWAVSDHLEKILEHLRLHSHHQLLQQIILISRSKSKL